MSEEQSSLKQFSRETDSKPSDWQDTSLGILPQDWDVSSLGEDFKIEYGTEKNQKGLQAEGYPVYGANGVIGYDDEYLFDEPVVAITCRGATCGNVHLTEPKSWVTNNSLVLLDGNGENLQYLVDALRYHSVKRAISGSAQPQITATMLSKMDYPIAPLSEQRKIATVLSTVDLAIEKTEEIINKNKQIATETLQNIAISGIGHSEFEEIRLGPKKVRVPAKWEISKFGDISDVQQGLQIAKSKRYRENAEDRYQYITVQYLNDPQNLSNNWYIEDPRDTVICEKEDILMTRTGNTGEVVTGVEGAFHNNFFKIQFDRNILLKDYLVNYLESEVIQDVLISYAGTTTIPDLNHGEFFNIPVLLPPIHEQQKICSVIDSLDEKNAHEKEYLSRLQRLKRGLQQDLLSGTIRTTDTNIEVPDEIVQHG